MEWENPAKKSLFQEVWNKEGSWEALDFATEVNAEFIS